MAILLLAFSAINLGAVLPLCFGGRSLTPQAARPLRAMLLNVNKRLGDVRRVKKAVQECDPDVVVLEEISSQWVSDLKWLTKSHQYCCIQPREDNFGIGLFSKYPLSESAVAYIGDAAVPSVIATIDVVKGAQSNRHGRALTRYCGFLLITVCIPTESSLSRRRSGPTSDRTITR